MHRAARTAGTLKTKFSAVEEFLLDALPPQGAWTEEEYLWLTDRSKRFVEFTDGYLEMLPWPTDKHQTILQFILGTVDRYLRPMDGRARFIGLRMRVRPGKFRAPDILVLLNASDERREDRFWYGADLVVEVVSPDDPGRDLIDKRKDYAEGKIPEYWIVNPLDETITVLSLGKRRYRKHGVFGRGQTATSLLLAGFAVDADQVFDAD